MKTIIEIIKIIAPALVAIPIVLFTKNIEKTNDKEMRLFGKKREAFTSILSLISKMLISIKAGFSWEYEMFGLVREEECDEFETNIQKEFLYPEAQDMYIINFIIELLRDNSTWVFNIMHPEESSGFNVNDIRLIEYLYKELSDNFRHQLFDKKKRSTGSKHRDIVFLKASRFIYSHLRHKKIIDQKKFKKFDYSENSISEILNEYHNHIKEFFNLLENHHEIKELSEFYLELKKSEKPNRQSIT